MNKKTDRYPWADHRNCRTKPSNFLLPKEVVFLKALPKSLAGKVLKKEWKNLTTGSC